MYRFSVTAECWEEIRRDSTRYRELLDYLRRGVLERKRCTFCGREYLAHYRGAKHRRYCSIRCRNDAYIERRRRRREKARNRVCRYCGREFKARRCDARYCSTGCRVAAYRRRKHVEEGEDPAHQGGGEGEHGSLKRIPVAAERRQRKAVREDGEGARTRKQGPGLGDPDPTCFDVGVERGG